VQTDRTDSGFLASGHHVFAIVQGSTYDDLRREAAEGSRRWIFPAMPSAA